MKAAGAAAGGKYQRPVGLVSHAGDRRESGLGNGGRLVTVTDDPVPGSGPVAGGRLGVRTVGLDLAGGSDTAVTFSERSRA